MKIYQISDWNIHFENDRSRTRAQCSFVCVPNKQHGMGFCRIMSLPDGAAIYGIWHCILGACSQQKRRDGWLTSDGEQTGTAWDVSDLSLKFRRPEPEIVRALEVLTSERVGWVKIHENTNKDVVNPPAHRPVTVPSPSGMLKEGKEGKGIELKRIEVPEVVENGVQKPIQKKTVPATVVPMSEVEKSLVVWFSRKPNQVFSYAEQSGIYEISKRPDLKSEIEEIDHFRRLPKTFFPQSLQSLLSKWDETLDRARTHTTRVENEAGPKPKSLLVKLAEENWPKSLL